MNRQRKTIPLPTETGREWPLGLPDEQSEESPRCKIDRQDRKPLSLPLPMEAAPHVKLSERLLLLEAITAQLVCERSREQLLHKALLLRFAIPEIEKHVVMVADRPTGQIQAVSGDLSPQLMDSITQPQMLPLWKHMLERREMLFVPNLAASRRFEPLRPLFLREGIDSLWWIPLYDGERMPAGALVLTFGKPYKPSPDDNTIVSLFASHLGMALRQQQLLDQLLAKTNEAEALLEENRRSLEDISLVHKVSATAYCTVQLDELLERLTRVMCETMHACCGAAFLQNDAGVLVQRSSYSGHADGLARYPPALNGACQYFFSDGKTRARFIPHVRKEPAARGFDAHGGDGSLLLCPLKAEGRVVGFLAIGNPAPRLREASATALLDTLCNEMSQGIENCYAHQEIVHARQELEAILQGTADGILVLDRERRIKVWNAAAGEMIGLPGPDLRGRSCREVLHCLPSWEESAEPCGDGREAAICERCVLTAGQAVADRDWALMGRDGRTIDVSISSVPLVSSPGVEEATILVLRDISHRRTVERMKSEFISTISHDLRTPLTAIKGYVSTMIDLGGELGDEEKNRYLRGIAKATNRLTRLVEDILNVSRIEQGRLYLERSLTPLDDLILSVVEEMQGQSSSHIIRLNLGRPLPELMIDAKKIEQVLVNLLDNAIKYSPNARNIEVEARLVKKREELAALRDPEGWEMPSISFPNVAVNIRDWGVGIVKDKQAALFTKFHRIDNGAQPFGVGVGLGLYICKAMVEAHGGSIWVKSSPGRGSTFTFCLPLPSA